MMTPCDSAWAAISGGTEDSIALRPSRSSTPNATAAWLLPSIATRSVTSVAPGRAAARSSFPLRQRSTSWTARGHQGYRGLTVQKAAGRRRQVLIDRVVHQLVPEHDPVVS